jgi:hypothetical protein
MPKKSKIPDKPSSDNVTRDKIDKHLSDRDDTISEQDMKNINTDQRQPDRNKKAENNNEEPKKEMPSAWDIVDEKE